MSLRCEIVTSSTQFSLTFWTKAKPNEIINFCPINKLICIESLSISVDLKFCDFLFLIIKDIINIMNSTRRLIFYVVYQIFNYYGLDIRVRVWSRIPIITINIKTHARPAQIERIENGLRKLARELLAIPI
jgi:hypothetical protein